MRRIPQDDATQDDFDHNYNQRNPSINRQEGYEGYCAHILLPFGKARDKFWHGCVTIINVIWLVLFGIFTFSIDAQCPDDIKTYGEVIFWTFFIMVLFDIALYIALNMYDESKTSLSFLTVGLIIWISLIILITFLTFFEMIATADWSFGYHDVAGCESLYYLIMLNLFWIIALFSLKLLGPVIYMFWDWLSTKILPLRRNNDDY